MTDPDQMPLIEPGDRAPAFALRDAGGRTHELATHRGRHVVLFFVPKLGSAQCTEEAKAFDAKRRTFARRGVVVLGVAPDTERVHRKFREAHQLAIPILIDERDGSDSPTTCVRYGVWRRKKLYGHEYLGVVRTTYVIDPDGRVSHRFDNVKVKGHVDEVLAALTLRAVSAAPSSHTPRAAGTSRGGRSPSRPPA